MVFKYIAKRINIYCRNPTYITWTDIIFTYLYIISIILILLYYIRNSIYIANEDIHKCEIKKSNKSCIKSEILHIIITQIGIIYGFSIAIYKLTDLSAASINCLCCCYSCISKKDDPNNSNTEIELNKSKEQCINI